MKIEVGEVSMFELPSQTNTESKNATNSTPNERMEPNYSSKLSEQNQPMKVMSGERTPSLRNIEIKNFNKSSINFGVS